MRIITSLSIYIALTCSLSANAQPIEDSARVSRGMNLSPQFFPNYIVEHERESQVYTVPLEMKGKNGNSFSSEFGYLNEWIGRSVSIVVDSSPLPYRVEVNGTVVGQSASGATPSLFDVTKVVREANNDLRIIYTPYEGMENIAPWHSEGGALGAVKVISQPTMYIDDVIVNTSSSQSASNAAIEVVLRSRALNERTSKLHYELRDSEGKVVHQGNRDVTISMRGSESVTIPAILYNSQLWSAEKPQMYRLTMSLQHRGRHQEYYTLDIGMRTVTLSPEGEILINGVPAELSATYIAANESIEQLEELTKGGLYNTYVVEAGPYNSELYNWADANGIYLIPTMPIDTSNAPQTIIRGGNPTNDPAWREYYKGVSLDMFRATRHHPSVIAFNLADCSLNGDNLYQSYLLLKSMEDPRPIIYLNNEGEWNSDNFKFECNVTRTEDIYDIYGAPTTTRTIELEQTQATKSRASKRRR